MSLFQYCAMDSMSIQQFNDCIDDMIVTSNELLDGWTSSTKQVSANYLTYDKIVPRTCNLFIGKIIFPFFS